MSNTNLAGFTLTASPQLTDYLVGYRSTSAGGEIRTTITSLLTVFQGASSYLTAIDQDLGTTSTPTFASTAISKAIAANTVANGITLSNTNAATTGNQAYSPYIEQIGYGFNSGGTLPGSNPVNFRFGVVPNQNLNNPNGHWVMECSVAGGAYSTVMTVGNDGTVEAPGIGSDGDLTSLGNVNCYGIIRAGNSGLVNLTGANGMILSAALNTVQAAQGGFGADVSASSGVPLFATGTATFTGTTGSGNFARATSPTFVTPVLGTPSSGTLTSCTGLPLSTGVTGNLAVTNLNSGTSASSTTFWRGDGTWATPAGSGTVTSVGWTGGIVTVATATTTPAFTIAGTSGGIPYFSSTTTWASSALLAANALMIGGGAGVAPSTTTTGSGILTFLGTPSSANFFAAITDETGSGLVVGSISPTITGTLTLGDATTPALSLASGKTNTGNITISGKTSGGLKLTTADATAQTVTVTAAAQTTGATSLTIPDQAGTSRNFVFDTLTQTLTNKTLTAPTMTAPVLGTPASGTVTNLTGTASININGTVGATTPAAGTFTTLGATGAVTLTAAVPQLVLGANATTKGGVKMFGNTSGDVTISPLAVAGTATALTVPAASGGLIASVTAITTVTGTPSSSNFLRGDGTWAVPSGSGTVTVVASGSLTSTALVTGGGTTTLQTPSATATMDSSGNISTPGSVTSGAGGSVAGYVALGQGTAPSAGTTNISIYAPSSVTSYVIALPGAAATGFYLGTNSSGTVTWTQVASNGSGNVLLSAGTAAIASGKTLTVSNTLTLAGTDSTTMTFPTTSATIARTDAGNTFTGASTATSWTLVTPVLGTPSSGTLSSCTVDGTTAVGFRTVPGNAQSTAYTTVLADSGKSIDHPAADANARTFTIDSNANVAYPVGTCLSFSNMTSQVVTIAITTDTMYLAGTGSTGSRSLAQYGVATARKILSTTWLINGTGLT